MTQNIIYWSGEEDELLIEFVKDHEILYNVKSKDFKKIHLKQYLWCEIGGILNKTDVDCRKRWSYVRDYYIRRRGKPGTGGEAAMKRAVLLSFLDGFNSSRRSTATNILGDENSEDIFTNESADIRDPTQAENNHHNNNDSEIARDSQSDEEEEETRNYLLNDSRRRHHLQTTSDQPSTTKKRRWTWQSEERLQHLEQVVQQRKPEATHHPPDTLDETDHFFMSMAKITKKLPRYDRAQLRMQIASLVGNAELQHISNQAEFRDSAASRSNNSSHSDALGNFLYRSSSGRNHRIASKEQTESANAGLTKHETILP